MNKKIFLTEKEKEIFKDEFDTILYYSDIFNFDNLRDIVKLKENISVLIQADLLSENIYLLDLILIEWLKYKHPLIWQNLMNEYDLFCYENDLREEMFQNKNLSEKKTERIFDTNQKNINIEKRIENFVNKLKNLLSGDQLLLKSVIELIFYLTDIENNEVKELFRKKAEEILKIKLSSYITIPRLNDFFVNFRLTEGEHIKEKNKEIKNTLKFKRLFRLHNLKIYLGVQNYLIKIGDKKFYTLPGVIDCFEKKREEFEEKIIMEYTQDLENIPDGELVSIRNPFLEEILIGIISYIDYNYLTIVKDIYKKIENKIGEKEKIGVENTETAQKNLEKIFNDLQEIKDYFKKLN